MKKLIKRTFDLVTTKKSEGNMKSKLIEGLGILFMLIGVTSIDFTLDGITFESIIFLLVTNLGWILYAYGNTLVSRDRSKRK